MSTLTEALSRHIAAPRVDVEAASLRRQAFVPELRAIDEQKRTITFVASTEAVDRYGDILRVAGWKLDSYRRNPVFLWAHRSGDPPIGRTTDVHVETSPKPALVQTVEFADKATYEFADTIFNLYRGKFLTSVSVGFRPLEQPKRIVDPDTNEWTGGYEFTSQELLETSGVPLPANPEAVARALGAGVVTEADVARCFAPGREGSRFATKEDWASLLPSIEKLEETLARVKGRIREARSAEIATAEEFERALRGETN